MPQPEYLQFGGMAVPEGVMMRSPHHYSVACRAPNGKIVVMTEPLAKTWIGRQKWLKKPFLRGTLALLDTMALGMKAMGWASNVQLDEKHAAPSDEPQPKRQSKAMENFEIACALVVSLAIGFLIFDVLPEAASQALFHNPMDKLGTGANYVAEVIKVFLFIGYLCLIRRLPAILDVFRYHGAEHKSINAIEAGQELSVESCTRQSRLHPRCGTNFAIVVLIVAFLLFPLIPRNLFAMQMGPLVVLVRLAVKLALLPFVAGISYEVIRLAGRFRNQTWVNVLLKPGLMTQYITTAEPNQEQIEVGIASLRAAMKAEETGELTNTDDYKPDLQAEPEAVASE